MPARASSYLRIELLLALLAFPLVAAGCGPRQIWGIDPDTLKADLAAGRYASLSAVDFTRQDPRDALRLSPDAPFYLSFVFASQNNDPASLRMLELAWDASPAPWKEEAGILLAERYNRDRSYDKAITVARGVLSVATPQGEERARRALVEALYWSKDDTGALREAAKLTTPDAEVLLFRGVSSLRLGLPGAHDLVLRLFLQEKVSPLHSRVYTFLVGEPTYMQLFSAPEQGLLGGMFALTQGQWSKGITQIETFLATPAASGLLGNGALIANLGNAFIYAAEPSQGAKYMLALAQRVSGQARWDSLEQAGRLLRRAKDYSGSLVPLRTVADESPQPAQRDRARWFIIDALFAMKVPDLPEAVAREAAGWSDPSYFVDVLQSRIAELVTGRRWTTLMKLWRGLDVPGPDEVRAQLSYVIARAWQEGFITRLPGDPAVTATDLFLDAERRSPWGYYGLLSSSMLGDLPDRTVPSAPLGDPKAQVVLDPVSLGFLRFGLTDSAYARFWAARDSLTDAQLGEAARRFAAAGDYRSSMYLIGAIARRRRLTLAELQMYYPRGYASVIDPLVTETSLSDHVLYGLVREESYFDADIVSSAGAIGLSQLMPATAAGVAKGLGIANPDLRDPTTNLTIGIRHFKDLTKSVSNTTKALLAYNAGLTRVRQWERASRGLPSDLFLETVPFAETRDYVRKILVSSVMYAYLYHDADPREAALSFFGIDAKSLDFGPERTGGRRPAER